MKVLLVGSTGMLGQALYKKMVLEHIEVITIARTNSIYSLDLLSEGSKLIEIVKDEKPDVIINTAAMINLKECEEHPVAAYELNAKVVDILSGISHEIKSYFVQISTDHYYLNDKRKLHSERDSILLLNEYAKTKYAGECFALQYNNALVIRTNIVGFRNRKNNPTFIEWVISSLQANEKIIGFDNFYTSSIDVTTFSDILMELIDNRVTGLLNVATTEAISKYEFINEVAKKLGKEKNVIKGKMSQHQGIKRANSLGLDINELTKYLDNQTIPTNKEVVERLIKQYKEGAFNELSK